MAMPSARNVERVDRDSRVAVFEGSGREESFETLNRVDLRRVCAALNVSVSQSMTNGDMIAAIDGRPVVPVTAAATPPVPTTGDGSAIESAIRAIAAGAAGVDENAVRAIVDESMAPVYKRLDAVTAPIVVTTSDGATVGSLDGHYHPVMPDVLRALAAGCHVQLVGPAGTGKTTIGRMVGKALGLPVYAINTGPTDSAAKLFGYMDAGGSYHRTPARDAYENGGVLILDELDNGHPAIVTTLNMMLDGGESCSFPDGMVARHDDFKVIVTMNTFGKGADRQYVGRTTLDAATLNRLVVGFEVDYDPVLERSLMGDSDHADSWLTEIQTMRENMNRAGLNHVISTRDVIAGVRLLDAGFTRQEARDMGVLFGLNVEAINTLTAGVRS